MFRKTAVLILAFLLAGVFCSCSLSPVLSGQEGGNAGDATDTDTFLSVMREIKAWGDRTAALGLRVHSEYYYSFAGASVGALRYAAESILWLKGEGDTMESFTSGSRYTGWETIAEINYASPYPSYFEGLLLEIQGKYEECIDPYAAASIMPLFPEEGLDFYYLKKMSVADLYELRDTLRAFEDTLYAVYTPALTGAEWDRNGFDPEYLLAKSRESVQSAEYGDALRYAKLALKADPFDAVVWQNAALCALYALDLELMGEYLDEGLTAFPEDETLQMLRQSMMDAVSEMEANP